MNGLDQEQLARLRDLLEQRSNALDAVAGAAITSHDLAVEEIETSPADKATVRLLNDLAHEAAGHQAAQRLIVRRALARFGDGSYGLCESCGNAIGFSRLQARPEAGLCIACQTRSERQ
jgi:DnaK suppressor protein